MNNHDATHDNRQGIQSVEVGIQLLRALADGGRPIKLRDIASAAGMVPSKAHRYLVSFIRTGLVEQDPESGLYDLGPYALQFSLSCLSRLDPVRLASSALAELGAQLDETVALAVWGNCGPTIIRWEESQRPVTVNVRTGSVMPLLTSATGQVFAAFLPAAMTGRLLEAERQALGQAEKPGLTTPADVDQLLADVRARRLARVTGGLLAGVDALSAPVFDHRGRLTLAITVLGQAGAFDADWDGRVATLLRSTAAKLSRRLGYGGGTDE